MDNESISQAQAQQRVNQIQAFEQELHSLAQEKAPTIPTASLAEIKHYHQQLLAQLVKNYDVDVNTKAKQLTLGMKIASLFGALAMAVSIFFLFYQFWGYLTTWAQVGVLISAPIVFFILTLHLTQQEKGAYFSKIAALLSLSCFVLNLSMLGQIFSLTPSANAFLIWGAFSVLLAYACNARLLLFFGICSISSFIAMKIGTWSGMYWISFGERPEHFFIPSIVIFLLPQRVNQQHFTGFASMYRLMAMVMVFLPMLILSNWGQISYLTWDIHFIEGFYQVAGFVLSTVAIWAGIKWRWSEVVNTGNVFFMLFLYTKFFDWWWDWLPKYIFFFVLGLSALLALMVFKRLRQHHVPQGASV